MSLLEKKVLITAGSTWVAIDEIRILTTKFTGRTGLEFAIACVKEGAIVTLLLGPSSIELPKITNLEIIRFEYYNELYSILMNDIIGTRNYDFIIHSAAIADYQLENYCNDKIVSNQEELVLRFSPTKKIFPILRKHYPHAYMIKFKLEVKKESTELKDIAQESMLVDNADMIIANDYQYINEQEHRAIILQKNSQEQISVLNKKEIITQTLLIINKIGTCIVRDANKVS